MGAYWLLGLAAALALGLGGAPAAAQPLPQGGMTANEIAAWLKRSGAPADVKPDTTTPGDQILYQCAGDGDERRCQSIQYATGWAPRADLTAEKANAWNSSHRYIKAYLTEKGSLYGEYDVDISPGGGFGLLDKSFDNWRTMLAEFKQFFGS
jgi:hypothetical protein